MSNNPQSPEELRRLQELAELFDDDTAPSPATTTPPTTPSGGSEVLNAAKHWGRALGRRTKELTEKAVEKTKETQEALARRAEEAKAAKAAKEAAAAEQARQQQEQEQAEREEAAKPDARSQPVDVCAPEPGLEPTTVAPEGPSRAQDPLAPVVVVEPEAVEPTPDVLAEEEAVKPADLSVASEALEDEEALPPSTPALRVADAAAVQPEPSPAHVAHAGSTSTTASRKKGWSIVVVASVACLVLGGGIAWWVTRDTGKNEPAPTAAPASAVAAPVSTLEVPGPGVKQAPPVSAPEPEQAPVAAEAPPALPVEKGAVPALAEAPRAAARAEVQPVEKGDKHAPDAVRKPARVGSKAMPAAEARAKPMARKSAAETPRDEPQWQEKADSDMDAWAKKAGIN